MHVAMLTYGSRGDVEPFVALGAGLHAQGHTAVLAAPVRFASLVAAHGLAFAPLPGDIDQLSRGLVERAGFSALAQVRLITAHTLAVAVEAMERMRAAAAGADLVVHSFLTTVAGHQIAGELGVPDVATQLFPFFVPYTTFPNFALPPASCGPWRNQASHRLATWVFALGSRLSYAWLRRRYPGLGPKRMPWPAPGVHTPLLLAYSPLLTGPTPAAAPRAQATGFWALSPGSYEPPPPLAAFLEAGPPPVFVGFGSMVTGQASQLGAAILEALGRAGRRALLQRGWTGLGTGALPPWALAVDEVPHGWLFPKMAAVIHHGGAGTTGAALRAGVPSLAIPFTADQPFWGWRAHQLGVGPRPIPAATLTADTLVAAFDMLDDVTVRRRAAAVGTALRAEDGVGTAVRLLSRSTANHRQV
jgi:sterol 3beta-glucosyltransferase